MTVTESLTARAWRPGVWDVMLGVTTVALGAEVLAKAGGGDGFRAADPLGYALTAIGCASTVWARRQPLAALIVAGVAFTLVVARDYHADLLPYVITGLLFMVASYRSRRDALTGLGAAAVFLVVSAATRPADLGLAALAQTAAVFTVVWLLGRLVRARRTTLLALVSEAEQRVAAQRQLASAERDRNRLSLVDERLRIARDVHDVLAHSMSVVSVQATPRRPGWDVCRSPFSRTSNGAIVLQISGHGRYLFLERFASDEGGRRVTIAEGELAYSTFRSPD